MYLAYVHVVFPTLAPVSAHPWTHFKLKPLSIPNQKEYIFFYKIFSKIVNKIGVQPPIQKKVQVLYSSWQ